jgi:hypothetical protein
MVEWIVIVHHIEEERILPAPLSNQTATLLRHLRLEEGQGMASRVGWDEKIIDGEGQV